MVSRDQPTVTPKKEGRIIPPLRQRMIEDLRIRNYSPQTIEGYVFYVSQVAQHFRKSPDLLGREEIRQYQAFLVRERKIAVSTLNVVVWVLRFFYEVTLGRSWEIEHLRYPRRANPAKGGTGGAEQRRTLPCVDSDPQPQAPDGADDIIRHGDEGVGGDSSVHGRH